MNETEMRHATSLIAATRLIAANGPDDNPFRGNFAFVDGEDRQSWGDRLEVRYLGGHFMPGVISGGFYVHCFPLAVLVGDSWRKVFFTTGSALVAGFLTAMFRKGCTHRLRLVKYANRQFSWYWPAVDGMKMGLRGQPVPAGFIDD